MTTQNSTKRWSQNSLGDICTFVYGKNLSEKNRIIGNIPVYGSNGVVGFHNIALVSSSGIVVGRKGSVGVVHFSATPFYPIDTTFYITQDNTKADLKFLFYLLKEIDLKKLKADVGVPGINREMVYREMVYLPDSVEEQRVIAQTLTTVQNAILEQEILIEKLKELKRNMMHHLFTRGTKYEKTKMMETCEVPESWEEVKIGSLGRVVTGSTPSTKVEKYYYPSEIDFISPGDIGYSKEIYSTERKISKEGFEVSRPIPKDAICCVCIGSSIGKVAKAYREATTNQQINSIICNASYDSEFVYYLMSFYSDMWRAHATFGPVPLLSKGSFSKINIPVPADLDEQKKIAKLLTVIEEKIEIIETKTSIYRNLFKTLLHELMSGERRIKNI